jgi:Ca2+-binding RTX toxin-like protein
VPGLRLVHILTGAGNDRLTVWDTVPADSILEGGDGNDKFGAGRRSLLIGGRGADTLLGYYGDDILVGGTTAFDGDGAALLRILRGTLVLNANPAAGPVTVFDDGAVDVLTGHRGIDTYYLSARDVLSDYYLTSEETFVRV